LFIIPNIFRTDYLENQLNIIGTKGIAITDISSEFGVSEVYHDNKYINLLSIAASKNIKKGNLILIVDYNKKLDMFVVEKAGFGLIKDN
jgi:hypothetical protein